MLLSQSPVWRSTASTYQSRSDLVACTGMVGPAYSPTQRAKPGKLRQNRAKWGKRRPPPIQASETNDEIGRDTSELQSRGHLVCRLLLEKKKKKQIVKNVIRRRQRHP